jgi:hypothetical protein
MTRITETIVRVQEPAQRFGRSWMLADSTNGYGVDLGFGSGAQFWVVGRAGVLGSCPTEVAAAAIAFEPPHKVREAWENVPQGLTHADVALHYRGRIVDWGERVLADADPAMLSDVVGLGCRIIDTAPASLGVIFAGWRALPLADSPPARAALTLNLLRELRGAAHIAAITACGLTPLDAILAATHEPPRTGHAYAERIGWPGPYRDPAEVRPRRVAAESLTTRILEPYYGELSTVELARLSAAVEDVCSTSPRV